MSKVPLRLKKLAKSGIGKPWAAACNGPWAPGNSSCVTYIYGKKSGLWGLTFWLEPGRIYFCQEPCWKRPKNDEILAEDDQIDFRRFYVRIADDGTILYPSDSEAEEFLRV